MQKTKTESNNLIERYLIEGDYSEKSKYFRRYALKRLFYSERFSFEMEPLDLKNLILDIFGYLEGGSFNLIHSTLKTFFDFCIKNRIYLDENPLNLIKRRKESKHEPNPFKDSEVEEILNKCPAKHRFMYEVFLNTGIRIEELTNLRFQDFDSERKMLHIRARTSGGGAKGDKARDIPLTDIILKKYQSYLVDSRLKIDITSDFVFLSQRKGKLAENSIWGRMNRLSKKLNIHIHAHRFRTTFATQLHRDGVDIYVISLLMGHESIETTTDYISVSLGMKRKAIEKSTWLGKQQEASKRIEEIHREKQDLVAMVDDLINQNETLLKRLKGLNIK